MVPDPEGGYSRRMTDPAWMRRSPRNRKKGGQRPDGGRLKSGAPASWNSAEDDVDAGCRASATKAL